MARRLSGDISAVASLRLGLKWAKDFSSKGRCRPRKSAMAPTASKRPWWCASQMSSYATQRHISGSRPRSTLVMYSLKRASTFAWPTRPSSHSLWLQAAEARPRCSTRTLTSACSPRSSTNSRRSTEFPGFPLASSRRRAPGSSQPSAQRSRCSSPKGHEHHSKMTCCRPSSPLTFMAASSVASFSLRSLGGVFRSTSRSERHHASTPWPCSRTAG
mmetsp:Transcript_43469/g.138386  ORF Transcript_43469/g.138386 Transcript_43469/m.138386 type:complete len:216 (-) Transcript_43469:656-1303(-)